MNKFIPKIKLTLKDVYTQRQALRSLGVPYNQNMRLYRAQNKGDITWSRRIGPNVYYLRSEIHAMGGKVIDVGHPPVPLSELLDLDEAREMLSPVTPAGGPVSHTFVYDHSDYRGGPLETVNTPGGILWTKESVREYVSNHKEPARTGG